MLGYVARLAEGGASAITMGGATGPFGLIATPRDWPQPWYDQAGGLYPMFHVLRGLAALQGLPRLSVSHGDTVEALAVKDGERTVLWIANRTGTEIVVSVPDGASNLFMLDENGFEAASRAPDAADVLAQPFSGSTLTLKPSAVARLGW